MAFLDNLVISKVINSENSPIGALMKYPINLIESRSEKSKMSHKKFEKSMNY